MATVAAFHVALAASVGRFVAPLRDAQRTWDSLARSVQRKSREMDAAQRKATLTSIALAKQLTRLAAVAGAASLGMGLLGVRLAAQFEQAALAFTTLLGSADEARDFLAFLERFARRTPFAFAQLQQMARQMLAWGFARREVERMVGPIGDLVAAMGGGQEQMDRVIRALGQIRARSVLASQEMLQLTEAGVPAWELLAERIGVTVPEAMKLVERRAVSAAIAIDAIVSGLERRFGGAMERQSRTLIGRWEQVKDAATIILRGFGEEIIRVTKLGDRLAWLAETLGRFADLVSARGFARALREAFPPWLPVVIGGIAGAITGALIPAVQALILWLTRLIVAQGIAMVALGQWAVIGAIVGVAIAALIALFGGLDGVLRSLGGVAQGAQDAGNAAVEAARNYQKMAASLQEVAAAAQDNIQSFDEIHELQDQLTLTIPEPPDLPTPPGAPGGGDLGSGLTDLTDQVRRSLDSATGSMRNFVAATDQARSAAEQAGTAWRRATSAVYGLGAAADTVAPQLSVPAPTFAPEWEHLGDVLRLKRQELEWTWGSPALAPVQAPAFSEGWGRLPQELASRSEELAASWSPPLLSPVPAPGLALEWDDLPRQMAEQAQATWEAWSPPLLSPVPAPSLAEGWDTLPTSVAEQARNLAGAWEPPKLAPVPAPQTTGWEALHEAIARHAERTRAAWGPPLLPPLPPPDLGPPWSGLAPAVAEQAQAVQEAWTPPAWPPVRPPELEGWESLRAGIDRAAESASGALQTLQTDVRLRLAAIDSDIAHYTDLISGRLQAGWQPGVTATRSAWDEIRSWVTRHWDAAEAALGSSLNGLAHVVTGLWQYVLARTQAAWAEIRAAVLTGWAETSLQVTDWASGIASGLVDAWTKLQDATQASWEAIRQAVGEGWANVWQSVAGFAEALRDDLTRAWSVTQQAAEQTWTAARNAVGSGWEATYSAVASASSATAEKLADTWSELQRTTESTWKAMRSAVRSSMEGLRRDVGSIARSMSGNVVDTTASMRLGVTSEVRLTAQNVRSETLTMSGSTTSTWQQMWQSMQSTAQAANAALLALIGASVLAILDQFRSLSVELVGQSVWTDMWAAMVTQTVQAIGQLNQSISQGLFGLIKANFETFRSDLQQRWVNFWKVELTSSMQTAWAKLIDDVLKDWDRFKATVQGDSTYLQGLWQALVDDLRTRFADFVAWIISSAIQRLITAFATWFGTTLAGAAAWLGQMLLNIAAAVAAFLQQAVAALTAWYWWLGPGAPAAAWATVAAAMALIGQITVGLVKGLMGLAEGGIVTGPTFAMLGEGGRREAVVPLERDNVLADSIGDAVYEAMVMALRAQAAQGDQPTTSGPREIVLRIDGAEFARAVLPALEREAERRGLQLAMRPGVA